MDGIDVVEQVRARNGWTVDGDHVVVPLPNGRRQTLLIESLREDGTAFLRVTTVVGNASSLGEVRLRAALTINAELRAGAIAIRGDALVLTDAFLVRGLDAEELNAAMTYVAATADQYERALFGTDAH